MALAKLEIKCQNDYLLMLKAICILVQEHQTQDAAAKEDQTKERLPVTLDKCILGLTHEMQLLMKLLKFCNCGI